MEFRILGPLEVYDGQELVQLDRRKARALLAFFVLHANEPLSSDRLIDELWGEQPPKTVAASLQNYVSRLRKVVGPEVLVSRPPGYMLQIDAEQVDAHRFERLLDEARDADPSERASKLREALALWRGRPLEDLAYESFAETEIRRLEELHLVALEERIDADLALGGGGELVGELESLVAEHPLRERFRRQLMLALYRVGRQSEALTAYREARTVLRDELGIEPSEELQRVERAILVHDQSLEPPSPPDAAALAPSVARKRVTVLFADLVESTVLAEMLDPEAYRGVLSGFYAEMGAVIGLHGGTVEKFSGDEVMAVFGVPVTHEDDALRAIRAALEMRRALEALNASLERDLDIQLGLRVGINTGEVAVGAAAVGGSFVTGAPVNVGKRLEQAAAPGDVLIGPTTLELVREAVETEAFGPVPLRGRAEPIEAHRVLGAVQGAPAIARRLSAPMVGRNDELARLRSELESVRAERTCRIVGVLGEAGIGKSRLVAELANTAREDWSVLVGKCVAYGEGATYLPLVDIVRQAGARSEGELEALLSGEDDAQLVARRIAELVGLAEGAVPAGEAPWAMRRFLEALARSRPLLVVLDDVHWAEPTLIDLLEYLEEWIETAPVLLVCIARPDVLHQRASWAPKNAFELAPLTDEDAATLVESIPSGSELDTAARERVVAVAEGNPLYAEQLMAYADEVGSEMLADVPPSLEALLASRLDLLDLQERSVLHRASIAGREFSHAGVVDLSPEAEAPAVERHLEGLAQKGLVWPAVDEGAFRFHHVLIRDVAYAGIPKRDRSDLHERYADWLDRQPGGTDEVVGYHLEQAFAYRTEVGPIDRAAQRLGEDAGERLGRAGLRAWGRGDTRATINLLGRATAMLPSESALRRELLCELGVAFRTAGDIDRADATLSEALADARAAEDRRIELRAELEAANVRLLRDPEGRADALLDIARRAIPTLEALGDDRALGRAYLLLGYVRGGLHCQNAEWANAAERAIQHYRRSGWSPSTCFGDLSAALFFGPTPVEEGVRRCEGLLGDEDIDRVGRANIVVWMAGMIALTGRLADARDLVLEAKAIYEELGRTVPIAGSCGPVLALIEALGEDMAGSAAVLEESCDTFLEMDEHIHVATLAAELAGALCAEGRLSEARRWAELAATTAAPDDLSARVAAQAVVAKLMALEGEVRDAERSAAEAIASLRQTDALIRRGRILLDAADVFRLTRRPDRARALVEDALSDFEAKGATLLASKARKELGEFAHA